MGNNLKICAMFFLITVSACSTKRESVEKIGPASDAKILIRDYVSSQGTLSAPTRDTFSGLGIDNLETLDVDKLNEYLARADIEDVNSLKQIAWFVEQCKDFDQDGIINVLDPDDDGDGFGDGYEISMDRNPFDANAIPKLSPFIITVLVPDEDLEFSFSAVPGVA